MNKNLLLIFGISFALTAFLHAEKPTAPFLSKGENLTYWRADVTHNIPRTLPEVALGSVEAQRAERTFKAFPRIANATGMRDGDTWVVVITSEGGKKQELWFAKGHYLNRTVSKYYGPMYNVIEHSSESQSTASVPFLQEFDWVGEKTFVEKADKNGKTCFVYKSPKPVVLPYSDALAKDNTSIATVFVDTKTKLPVSAETNSTILTFTYERPAGVKVNIPPEATAALKQYLDAMSSP
jgi:hypothetical protein